VMENLDTGLMNELFGSLHKPRPYRERITEISGSVPSLLRQISPRRASHTQGTLNEIFIIKGNMKR
jgi:hypothetical protein